MTREERQRAKPVVFGLPLGMGAQGLADYAASDFGVFMTVEEAEVWRQGFFTLYAGIEMWMNSVRMARSPETRTLGGRVRYFDNPEAEYTAQLASIIQGTAADGMKSALALMYNPLGELGARVVLVLHDEVLVEAPERSPTK